eukprot:scaffold287981_cov28-Prasinocladus_malaysianus.AAC.1
MHLYVVRIAWRYFEQRSMDEMSLKWLCAGKICAVKSGFWRQEGLRHRPGGTLAGRRRSTPSACYDSRWSRQRETASDPRSVC